MQKEKIINIYNEVLLRLSQTERDRLGREIWFARSDGDDNKADEIKRNRDNIDNVEIKKIESNISSQKEKIKQAEIEVKKVEDEFSQVKDAVKFTADFYQSVFKSYGEKAEQLAKALADQARGNKIRNIEDALKAYEKHKANINKKINAKDRKAIATALESVKVADIANNFKRFSKGMLHTSSVIDFADWTTELYKATETGNWRPFFVKTEAIVAGRAATVVVAFMFSVLLSNPIGLLGYGLIMAIAGYLINDEMVEKANQFWSI